MVSSSDKNICVVHTTELQMTSLGTRMDYFCHKIKGLRQPRPESPKYQRARIIQETCSPRLSTNSDTSYYTASPNFIDRVILGRSIYIKRQSEEEANFAESEFVIDCLQWHNIFREKHDVPELKLNNHLCSMAQFWANHLAHTNTFSHRNLRDIGENLFCKWSYIPDLDITGQQVTKYWYEEIKMYNFFQEPNLLHVRAGHFTQMVWRSSTDFGVGKARSRCGKVIVAANYKPGGNVIGEFQDNVFPPINDMDILNEIG